MVTVYTMDNCQPCKMTKRELTKNEIPFVEVNLADNPEALDELKAKGFTKAPIVVPANGEPWSGFAPSKIKGLVTA